MRIVLSKCCPQPAKGHHSIARPHQVMGSPGDDKVGPWTVAGDRLVDSRRGVIVRVAPTVMRRGSFPVTPIVAQNQSAIELCGHGCPPPTPLQYLPARRIPLPDRPAQGVGYRTPDVPTTWLMDGDCEVFSKAIAC